MMKLTWTMMEKERSEESAVVHDGEKENEAVEKLMRIQMKTKMTLETI